MSNQTQNQHLPAVVPVDPAMLERVLVTGDIRGLSPQQRLSYYYMRCEAAGLDPRAQPFQFVELQGKLTLYATKAATQQLAAKHSIVLQIVDQRAENDLRVVTCRGTTKDGRATDEIGAVAIKGLSGESLANAYMKAITKAKRRTVLSLCGLGEMDETEVESIGPRARAVAFGEVIAEDDLPEYPGDAPAARALPAPQQPAAAPSPAPQPSRAKIDKNVQASLLEAIQDAGWPQGRAFERAQAIAKLRGGVAIATFGELTQDEALELVNELDAAATARKKAERAAALAQQQAPAATPPGPVGVSVAAANASPIPPGPQAPPPLVNAIKGVSNESGFRNPEELRRFMVDVTGREDVTFKAGPGALTEPEGRRVLHALRERKAQQAAPAGAA